MALELKPTQTYGDRRGSYDRDQAADLYTGCRPLPAPIFEVPKNLTPIVLEADATLAIRGDNRSDERRDPARSRKIVRTG